MGIMTFDAIHAALQDGMVLGKIELGLLLQMAGETDRRVFAGINNEPASATANRHMLTAGTMAGFTTNLVGHFSPFHLDPRVRAGQEIATDVGMAVVTGPIADEGSAFNHGRRHNRALQAGTRNEGQARQRQPDS